MMVMFLLLDVKLGKVLSPMFGPTHRVPLFEKVIVPPYVTKPLPLLTRQTFSWAPTLIGVVVGKAMVRVQSVH